MILALVIKHKMVFIKTRELKSVIGPLTEDGNLKISYPMR
jgi:hypothetical protein